MTRLVLLAFIFVSHAVVANDLTSALVIEDTRVVVKASSWKSETVHLSIVGEDGLRVVDEQLYGSADDQAFDLSALPSKHYTLTIENKYKLYQVKLLVTTEGVQKTIEVATYEKPNAYVKDNHLHLLFNTPDEDAVIAIYNEKAKRVKTLTVEAGHIDEAIKLKGLRKGKYVAHIANSVVQRVLPFQK